MKVILNKVYQHTIFTACIHLTRQLVTHQDVFLPKFFMHFLPLTPRLREPARHLLGSTAMSVAVCDRQMPYHVTSVIACTILHKS